MKETISEFLKNFKSGTKLMFKEFFNKETNKKQRANMWTFSRLIISFLIPICSLISVLTANIGLFIASIGITGFGALTDFFDGRSARKHNSFSEYGKMLDQVADKVFSGMIGINLAIFNPLFLITILGEILIMCVNGLYKIQYPNLDIKSTQMGRIKQWPLFSSLVLGFISTLLPQLTAITNILIVLTFILQTTTASSYIKQNNKKVNELLKENSMNQVETNYKEDKEKNKLLEKKNNYSRKKELENLKKLKNELIVDTNEKTDEIGFQKTKK